MERDARMRVDFQEEILKFILQTKEGKKYADLLEKELWDAPTNQIVFELYSGYLKKFKGIPSKVTLMEFFDRELKKKKGEKITKDVYDALERQINYLYSPYESDTGLIRASIIEFAQRKKAKNLFRDNADKLAEGDDEFFRRLVKDMNAVVKISEELVDRHEYRSGFVLREFTEAVFHQMDEDVTPTFLRSLNKMTSAGGFYSPQLIILMGAPKSFKTGVLLSLCKEFVRDGKKVYYADTENGEKAIKLRFYQSVMECKRSEFREKTIREETKELISRFGMMGGDMQIGFYPAGSNTLDDVDEELQWLKDEYNWEPDLIVYDYLDLFKSANKDLKEKRFQIQDVYHHAVRINKKRKTFSISVSTVNKNAVNKAVIDITHFGEDFAKAYNCHAAFAICRLPEEVDAGVARILPVAQREGVEYKGVNTCFVEFDQEHAMVRELTIEQATDRVAIAVASAKKEPEEETRRSKKIRRKSVDDE